jgi:glycosyltransferase involved in cell wall biosynthesis
MTQPSSDVTDREIEELKTHVEELKVFPRVDLSRKGIVSKIRRFGNFLREGTPPNTRAIDNPEIRRWLNECLAANRFDAITCEHIVNEIFIGPRWREKVKTVANIHSSVSRTCRNQLETGISENATRDRLYLPLLERYERRFCDKFTSLVVTTEEDKSQIEALGIDRPISVIPNGVDLEMFPYRSGDPGGYRLVIAGGMDYGANIDSARFLALEIFPVVREKYPDATLTIVGSNPADSVLELANNPGITVTGRVPSMVDYLHRATVCVVPTRAGFGIKNKTLEALAAGVPVVASDRGLEGLSVDGGNVPPRALRANSIGEYVAAIDRLFVSPELRETLSRNGRALIEESYTWERAGAAYDRILREGIEAG